MLTCYPGKPTVSNNRYPTIQFKRLLLNSKVHQLGHGNTAEPIYIKKRRILTSALRTLFKKSSCNFCIENYVTINLKSVWLVFSITDSLTNALSTLIISMTLKKNQLPKYLYIMRCSLFIYVNVRDNLELKTAN